MIRISSTLTFYELLQFQLEFQSKMLGSLKDRTYIIVNVYYKMNILKQGIKINMQYYETDLHCLHKLKIYANIFLMIKIIVYYYMKVPVLPDSVQYGPTK